MLSGSSYSDITSLAGCAVKYYADNFEIIYSVIETLDPEEAASIEEAQNLMECVDVKISLISISNTFAVIPTTIKKLESTGMEIGEVIELISNVENTLKPNYDKKYILKLTNVLSKNKGFSLIKEVHSILCGKPVKKISEFVTQLSPSDVKSLKFAPLVSCDVERVFSHYKTTLADNRRTFLFENLKMHVIAKCNQIS